MAAKRAIHLCVVGTLVIGGLAGCQASSATQNTQSTTTAEPASGYLTEPPKKAQGAADDANSAIGGTQDGVDSLEDPE
ncbi:MAG: hypothetical protein L6413_00930 [Coriobacteriia bacterium]|nr:hypothetical protein [Coriobacteriia bacterium]